MKQGSGGKEAERAVEGEGRVVNLLYVLFTSDWKSERKKYVVNS